MSNYPVALTIAGSDSGGGAGIQADLKAIASFGVYGASVLTAVTAQNTVTVSAVQEVRPDVVEAQIAAVLDDFDVKAVKIGMLASSVIVRAVARGLLEYRGAVVLDPVMVAKSGDSLLRDDAVAALTGELVPRATILTPNLPEVARLLGQEAADSIPARTEQGNALLDLGPSAVLMKGGHAAGAECHDVLVMRDAEPRVFSSARIDTRHTHGTGCTLSSAIAASLARGNAIPAAVEAAHAYLHDAIRAADTLDLGSGHGPVHHFYWDDRHDR